MRTMRIDFAAPGWRRTLFRLHPALLAAGACGLALCVGAALAGYRMAGEQREREQQLRQVQQRHAARAEAAAPAARSAIPEAQAKAVNAAVLQLNLPWRDLQDAVAAATPPTVALVALEPDPRKQVLKITAETKSSDDMIAYIELLKQQEFFTGAALLRHEIHDLDPNRPLRFQAEVQWVAR